MYCTLVQLYLTRSELNARTENLRLQHAKGRKNKISAKKVLMVHTYFKETEQEQLDTAEKDAFQTR